MTITDRNAWYRYMMRLVPRAASEKFDNFLDLDKKPIKGKRRDRLSNEKFEKKLKEFAATLTSPFLNRPTPQTLWSLGLLIFSTKLKTCRAM